MKHLDPAKYTVVRDWRLNERHYGDENSREDRGEGNFCQVFDDSHVEHPTW